MKPAQIVTSPSGAGTGAQGRPIASSGGVMALAATHACDAKVRRCGSAWDMI